MYERAKSKIVYTVAILPTSILTGVTPIANIARPLISLTASSIPQSVLTVGNSWAIAIR